MAEVLCVYREVELLKQSAIAQEQEVPVLAIISYDKKPGVQAIGTTAPDLPPEPLRHDCMARDHEYIRHGTLSLLAGIDLVTGAVHASVEERHRSREFVAFMQKLDAVYPLSTAIKLILDYHSAHISKETKTWLAMQPEGRLTFVFTPKHGSWLNLVGPGLGGHCIPIDPFYLTWKAHEYGIATLFIELAGEINTRMPHHVVSRVAEVLDRKAGVSSRASVLILGISYKQNIGEMRESPSLMLLELLEARGAHMEFCDPHIPLIPETREHGHLARRRAVDCSRETIAKFDVALIATDHDAFDYNDLVTHAKLIVGTRNACGVRGPTDEKIVKA